VTHFFTGEVTVLDPDTGTVVAVIATGLDSNLCQKITLSADGSRAYLPHVRSNVINPSLLFDDTVFPVVTVLDLADNKLINSERFNLAVMDRPVNLPFDVAFAPDGSRMYVLNLGSGDISVLDPVQRRAVAHIEVGDIPQGMVVAPDGAKGYVINSLAGEVSILDLTVNTEIKRVAVTQSPLSAELRLGKQVFFSSRSAMTSRDRWMSCASCHFDGDHDGRTWLFRDGPRNTTGLRGMTETLPLHWSADRDELQDFEHTIRSLQAGTGLINGAPNPELGAPNAGLSASLDAMAAFIASLPLKASPYLEPDGSLGPAALRGKAVFERGDTGCAICHVPGTFTDSTLATSPFILHDVGTGGGAGEKLGPGFDTPSLRGIWDTAPYLHDGRAATLMDVLTTGNPADRHGSTSQLSTEEREDLVAYLRSL